jgi:DNA invertase Pin-like site-specific DNA recombinase
VAKQMKCKRDDRPGLEACLKALRDGDTLNIWKLDRLGRDLKHLVTTVRGLSERGVGLSVLTGQGANIDNHDIKWEAHLRDIRRPR